MSKTLRQKFEKVWSHYKVLGWWDTCKQIGIHFLLKSRDKGFDRKYGTDTGYVMSTQPDEFSKPGQVAPVPSNPRVIKYIIRHLGIDYRNFLFLDFGCGKGRALLCASDFPFKRIVGVEWSEKVCAIAQRNLEIYKSKRQKCTDLEVQCLNALDYQFPASDTVLYLYNPFSTEILKEVFANIQRSVLANPRRFLVVFCGLAPFFSYLLLEFFEQFGIDVVRRYDALAPYASWILGEVRRTSGPTTIGSQ